MKQTSWFKRALSLVLTLALVCSLAPVAMAKTYYDDEFYIDLDETLKIDVDDYASEPYYTFEVESDSKYIKARVKGDQVEVYAASNAEDGDDAEITVRTYDNRDKWVETLYFYVCVDERSSGSSGNGKYVKISDTSLTLKTDDEETLYIDAIDDDIEISSVTWSSSNSKVVAIDSGSKYIPSDGSYAQVDIYSLSETGTATITATVSGKDYSGSRSTSFKATLTCKVTVSKNGSSSSGSNKYVEISDTSLTLKLDDEETLYIDGIDDDIEISSVTWSSSNSKVVAIDSDSEYIAKDGSYAQVDIYSLSQTGTATITATVSGKDYSGSNRGTSFKATLTCKVTVSKNGSSSGNTNTDVSKDDYKKYDVVVLLEADADESFYLDDKGIDVLDQIDDEIYSHTKDKKIVFDYLTFSKVSSNYGELSAKTGTKYYADSDEKNYLGDIRFYADASGVAEFPFTAYDTDKNSYSGILVVVVDGDSTASVDILYTTTTSKTFDLDINDFEDFWAATYSKGELSSVTFGTPSGNVGTLYYTNNSNKPTSASGATFYVDPTSKQFSIDDVYFTPQGTRTGTLTVPFTAKGSTKANGSANTTLKGTMYIVVTSGAINTITYTASSGAVQFVASDFQTVYRTAMGSNASSLYIQLLNVPTYGTLYYGTNLTNSNKLTASNVGNRRYGTGTGSKTYNISGLTYVPGTNGAAETIRYVAYSASTGGAPLYVGEITFNARSITLNISYVAPGGSAVTFKTADFFGTDKLQSGEYISFNSIPSGTLYRNYSNGNGTQVSTSSNWFTSSATSSVPAISAATFVPKAGYTGPVKLSFNAYSATGSVIGSGTVTIYATARTYNDIPSSQWAWDYIYRLAAAGVVNGTGDGSAYSPTMAVSYGMAIKMITLAAGYPDPGNATTGNWASNYVRQAYQRGIIDNANLNPDQLITRTAMAELVCRTLGISQASSIKAGITGPSDSTNGYVYALYNAGILNGTNTNGKNYFNGSNSFNRDEMAKVVCMIMDYVANQKG